VLFRLKVCLRGAPLKVQCDTIDLVLYLALLELVLLICSEGKMQGSCLTGRENSRGQWRFERGLRFTPLFSRIGFASSRFYTT
jgi:hypothetical protein